jgi:Uma2 family endonuclease
VIVEVLSPSTEAYDRGLKFEHFRSLESFRDYLLVHQNKVHVEHFARREGNQWVLSEWRKPPDTIKIDSVGCQLNLAEIYEKTNLSE